MRHTYLIIYNVFMMNSRLESAKFSWNGVEFRLVSPLLLIFLLPPLPLAQFRQFHVVRKSL